MKMEVIEMGVSYTHHNGCVLEMVGEQSDGEWFAYRADGTCFAQGFYEYDAEGEGIFFQDEDNQDMNADEPVAHNEMEGFIKLILEGNH